MLHNSIDGRNSTGARVNAMKLYASALYFIALLMWSPLAVGQSEQARLEASVQQLRDAVGDWAVTTEFLNEDGTVANTAEGTYHFEWVIEDRVLSGYSEIPDMDMRSALLFYVNENKGTIEMVSLGKDGKLWIMTGPLGSETRYSEPFATQSGGQAQLRFTRFNVNENAFESRMEFTEDNGETWKPGNHQVFRRAE